MKIWNFIKEKISENKGVFLLTVLESKGSSPGKQGFKMAVSDDKCLSGSIGGGTMEYELVEKCKSLLLSRNKENFILVQQHNEDVNDESGMICSGEQTIGFIYLDEEKLNVITDIVKNLESGKPIAIRLSNNGLASSDKALTHTIEYKSEDNQWSYSEIIGIKNIMYVIGAGHVGYAVSRLFSQLDFEVILFDNRHEHSMLEENPYASVKKVIDYNKIESYIEEGKNSYVIIATNKHTGDKLILSKLIRKNLGYLGLLGSKAKVAKFKEQLLGEDFSKLHAPIGLKINSITPDEIAVSIAAEVIMVKNEQI